MNEGLLILGAGGHGQVAKETAQALGFSHVDFLDDASKAVIGKLNDFYLFRNEYKYAFVAIGNNLMRMKLVEELIKVGYLIPVLIHPTAFVSPNAKVEMGTIIGAKAVVNTNTQVKKGSIISIGALIDHDSIIDEYAHINTGAVIKSCTVVGKFKKIDAGEIYYKEKTSKEVGV